jgi:membrane protease subunit HflC
MTSSGVVAAMIVIILALIVLLGSAFIVNEAEQVIITQFGKPIDRQIVTPGLKFKVPFIQKAHRFDKRFLEWDGDPNQLPTRDKRFIWVDTYARWRITDPLLFFQRLRDERGAQTRLDDILDGEARNSIANHDLIEVIRTTNREAEASPEETAQDDENQLGALAPISVGRELIRREILAASASRTHDLGIEILDVQFKRINYVEEVRRKVYDRMVSERKRIADRFRSEGQGEASRIRGERERELRRISSDAYRRSQEIIGRADSVATRIYSAAYNPSSDTREFYSFLRTMESYRSTIDPNTWLILSTDGEFYRYLKDGSSKGK